MPRIVALLTDYGTRDQYAGSLRGAVLAACPDAQVVDVSHDIKRHAVREAAFVLRACVPVFPAGTAFAAVVDPGVGTARRPIGLLTGRGDILIGPDNGLLMPAAEQNGPSAAMCWRARISVGTIKAPCAPLSTAAERASSATTVLPDPTSPCSRRSMRWGAAMSRRISPMALVCAPVSA